MKTKTMNVTELSDRALNFAVAQAVGVKVELANGNNLVFDAYNDDYSAFVNTWNDYRWQSWCPTRDWGQGGPIIERECIFIAPTWDGENAGSSARSSRTAWIEGPTALVAAMRCYVASKLGATVEIPEALL